MLDNLAVLYSNKGEYALAEPLSKRAAGIFEKAYGPENPDLAVCLDNLARIYKAQGKYDEAITHYKRSLAIFEKVLGPDHPDVASC